MSAKLFRVAVLLALGLFGQAAGYTVKSSVACRDIIREDSHESYREMNKWWLMGYFTGRNYAINAEAGKAVEDEELYQMALGYCRNNPDGDWDDAAIHIYDQVD